jgi:serine/threonine-protein kinase
VPDELSAGSRIGRYRIEELLGTGSMGSVWLGIDEVLLRKVALKVLHNDRAAGPELRERFIRDAAAAAAIDHPNIIPIYETGESDGRLFIAMHCVNGGDVQKLLSTAGKLTPARVVAIVTDIASALDAARASGLIHGGVKPGNMLLHSLYGPDDDPHVYLADFGLSTSPVSMPTAGLPSPRRQPDDLWGLAWSAYLMLSGRRPEWEQPKGAAPDSLPSLRAHAGLAPGVAELIQRVLRATAGARFASCGEFAIALGEALRVAPRKPVEIRLPTGFRYVQEPYRGSNAVYPSLGHDRLVADLQNRIRHSTGGTFLITGFLGVGKTSLAVRALDELAARCGPAELVVPVLISVARSTTTESLLFAIIRRISETLRDTGVLERLPPQARAELDLAYRRTQLAITETRSQTRQVSAGLTLAAGPAGTVTRGSTRTFEDALRPYAEGDAEQDLIRIVSLVGDQPLASPRQRSWVGRLSQRRPPAQAQRLRLVVVLDEVDKLTTDDAGMTAVEGLLRGTRNVLTTTRAHFLIVAGPDLYDRVSRAAGRGNEIHRSVFAWQLYVPCIWDAPQRFIADIGGADGNAAFTHYLAFKARGIPRLLLQEVSNFVIWPDDDRHDDGPRLYVPVSSMAQIRFYARLEQIIREFASQSRQARAPAEPITRDRQRLGSYYLVDQVLRTEGLPFTAAGLLRDGEESQFDPLLGISAKTADPLLDHLARHGILHVVREKADPAATVIGDVAEVAARVFRLSDRASAELYGADWHHGGAWAADVASLAEPEAELPSVRTTPVARRGAASSPREQAGDTAEPAADPVAGAAEPAGGRLVIGGRYMLGKLLSQGALGSTHRGHEISTGRQVRVKVLRRDLASVDVARARFRREAEVLGRLEHPQVVRTLEVIDEPDTHAIIMEPLAGLTLEELVREEGPVPADGVAAIGHILAEALAYLAAAQVVRLDLKPGNIIMADRGPVIAGLSIAVVLDDNAEGAVSQESGMIGTPAFMAPEVMAGARPDAQADIYALGLVLYYCLGGQLPWQHLTSVDAVVAAVNHEQVDLTQLPVSADFRGVLARATARNPGDRLADAVALRNALQATPEWRSANGIPP